jgi:hypothetical protein
MNRNNQQGITTFWGISIIFMEVVVVLFVFYILYFFWIENPTPTDDIVIVKLFRRPTVSISSIQQPPSDWSTYQNVTFSFALRYPSSYKIKEGEIDYNAAKGHVFSLLKDGQEKFWLRIFPCQPSDKTIAAAYQRLTNIDPTVYQAYPQRVSGGEAIVYRLAPGAKPRDHVFFMSSDYFFEAPLDTLSAQILGTFIFIK